MTENIPYLSNFEEHNRGYVAFGGNPKGGKITGKGKIRTGKLDFDNVYFVKELKFNLFSVSQMCDKKNSVLFINTECIVLSSDFKLPDENHLLLRVPKENNMYNVDLKNIVPSGDLTCLFVKDPLDEFNLWHRRLGIISFKTMNKLVKGNLVRGLPSKVFENNHTCVACKKSKQHRASCKSKPELLLGSTPSIGFMRPFGRPVTILNTLDPLGTFDRNADDEFLVGYSVSSKAFRVFNSRTKIVQETLHVNFLENQPNVAGSGPTWLFDIDTLIQSMNYQQVVAGNQPNSSVSIQENLNVGTVGKETKTVQQYVLLPLWSFGSKDPQNTNAAASEVKKTESVVHVSPSSYDKPQKHDDKTKREAKGKSPVEFTLVTTVGPNSTNGTNTFSAAGPSNNAVSSNFELGGKSSFVDPSQYPDDPDMPALEDITYSDDKEDVLVDLPKGKRAIGSKWVFRNKKDERGLVVRNKARLVAQVHTQEEGIDYEEVFTPIARIEAIRLFLSCAFFMGFMVYQMDVKSVFLYGTIKEEVYVCQPPGFEDPDYPDKVYKVVKALYGLDQALTPWYETLANYLLENGFQRGKIDQTLFIKKKKGDILLVQMSSMGEHTLFLGLQVKQKQDGIFISQDKYIAEILRKFGLTDGKSDSTPIDTEKPLLKDPDVKRIFRYLKGKPYVGLWYPKDLPFNLVAYSDSDYARESLDRKSITGDCQFLSCRLISWQCKKQTVVSTSSTKAEYVVAASCCA
nr:putative ribonuclease H-like domain-containing protein [Tanacetum cinerariifolium]